MRALSKELFPLPSRALRFWDQTPTPLPGVTATSSAKLSELTKLNNDLHHIYFNDQGFHNHLTHHLFAAWSFGGSAPLLQEVFDLHKGDQRDKYPSPEPITDENWTQHLGQINEDYYQAYYDFFSQKISSGLEGLSQTLEKYIFSDEANYGSGAMMLARFSNGLLHPMIHTGHIEFGMMGMAAEGLAQACVTNLRTPELFPEEFFRNPTPVTDVGSLSSKLEPASISSGPKIRSHIAAVRPGADAQKGQSAFTIIARMLGDERLEPHKIRSLDTETPLRDTMKSVGHITREYARTWFVPFDEVKSKIEELQWLVTVIYGIGGWRDGKEFKADFFLTHLVTSSSFLPSIAAYLSPSSQSRLLRAHFSMTLSYWLERGRPQLPVERFFKTVTAQPAPPNIKVRPSKRALGQAVSFGGSTETPVSAIQAGNPWLGIVQSALHHPDEHLLKIIRALKHYDEIYGRRPAGWIMGTGLDGEETLDGSLFLRVAGNTMSALGWVREGQEPGDYTRAGLGWEDSWL